MSPTGSNEEKTVIGNNSYITIGVLIVLAAFIFGCGTIVEKVQSQGDRISALQGKVETLSSKIDTLTGAINGHIKSSDKLGINN